jgi:hypothetical protein
MSRVRTALALLALSAAPALAQSIPPVSRSKLVATHAVNQTNAHTTAMTADTSAPADRAPRPQVEALPQSDTAQAVKKTESAAGSTSVSTPRPGAPFEREVFSYDRAGRRDPFVSLMSTGELRPLVSDLLLVAVAYDGVGRGSVAVLRDINSKEQYRIRVGQSLGRMRVAAINLKSVTFTIEEFGFSRQEVLGLSDSNKGSTK